MHEKSIELLNKAVAEEIYAVHQYMYFHFHCNDQDYQLISGLFQRTAIEEMMHAELCAERILFLGGEVEVKAAREVEKITDVKEMLKLACKMEEEAVVSYNKWANECYTNADAASRKLFEGLVDDEERHWDQYNQEVDNITKYGDDYLALQSIEGSKSRASGPAA